jgi:hypothetical protein
LTVCQELSLLEPGVEGLQLATLEAYRPQDRIAAAQKIDIDDL